MTPEDEPEEIKSDRLSPERPGDNQRLRKEVSDRDEM